MSQKNTLPMFRRIDGDIFRSVKDDFITPLSILCDDLFNDYFPAVSKEFGNDLVTKGAYPKCDVIEYRDKIGIELEIAGLKREEIDLKVEDSTLIVSGQKRAVKMIPDCKTYEESKEILDDKDRPIKYLYRELRKSAFRRSFELGDNLDKEAIKAKFEDNVLKIDIPKKITEQKIEQKENKINIE